MVSSRALYHDVSNAEDADTAEGVRLRPALDKFNRLFTQIWQCADVGALASLVASWDDPVLAEGVISRQVETDRGVRMQVMLREQAGLTDLGGPTWRVADDRSCDPSFHFEPGVAIRLRWSPLLCDYLCCEQSTWPLHLESSASEQVEKRRQEGGGRAAYDDNYCPSCPQCGTESVSWSTWNTRYPPDGGRCYDCDYVHRSYDDDDYYASVSEFESDDD